ncbi:hypothetical protein [Novosphingobium olei]|uniref:hypothetical protein n=1 Tax=Novosphingobium olei TaxID=2728851 RepID=UPI00308BCDD2|nr:MASE1 domain-containing protein [Novosphingobium olei]
MQRARESRSCTVTVIVYAMAVSYSILVSRFEGGIAMIWVGGPVLAARLVETPRPLWLRTLLWCMLVNVVITGCIGLGWGPAVPLAVVNVAEATGAALILRVLLRSCWPEDALELVAGYYLGIGLLVPLGGAALGTLVLPLIVPFHGAHSFFHWFIGHAVGLIMAIPVSLTLSRLAGGRERFEHEEVVSSVLQLAVMALLTYAVFTQTMPIALLLPMALAVCVAWFGNALIATSLPVVLAMIGGRLTRAGYGPFQLLDLPLGDRMQLFALYAAAATLCVLPLVCERAARHRRRATLVMALD